MDSKIYSRYFSLIGAIFRGEGGPYEKVVESKFELGFHIAIPPLSTKGK